ncbi:MAG: histidinol-phosphatase HisJ family protein [Oscillospiraceae bacterium]
MLFDQHVHTNHSKDGRDSMEDVIISAIRKGLTGIAITDHCNYGCGVFDDPVPAVRDSFNEICSLRKKFDNRIVISAGVEIGQALQAGDLGKKAFKACKYDVILASVHSVPGETDFCTWQGRCENPKKEMEKYLMEVLKTAKTTDYDILAHLTYPWRYFEKDLSFPPPANFQEIIEEIFKVIIKKGKSLELNVSGFHREPHFQPLPDIETLKFYKSLGGELVTIGSDAHCTNYVGESLNEGAELLKAAGFNYQAFYTQRIPTAYKL